MKSKAGSASAIVITIVTILLLLALGGGIFYMCYIDSISIGNGENGVMTVYIGDEGLIDVQFPEKVYISKKCDYTSSDSTIVSVDANGKYKAYKIGETTIKAKTQLFGREAEIKVVVDYGEPDKLVVETIQGGIQYVGDQAEQVELKATTYRKGYPSQDPTKLTYKWEIYEESLFIPKDTISTGTTNYLAYNYPVDEFGRVDKYHNTIIKCNIYYNGKLIKISNYGKEEEQQSIVSKKISVFEPIEEKDVYIKLKSNNANVDTSQLIEMGSTINIYMQSVNANVNPNAIVRWSYSVNGSQSKEIENKSLLIDVEGTYTITGVIIENTKADGERRTVKTISFGTKYQEVNSLVFADSETDEVKTVIKQIPDSISEFKIKVKWNEFASPTQTITLTVKGVNNELAESSKSFTLTGDRSVLVTVSPVKVYNKNKYEIYINTAQTGLYIDLDNGKPLITLQARHNETNTISQEFRYEVSESEVENIKLVASTDDNFDQTESKQIVGQNNYNLNSSVMVKANLYPVNSFSGVEWYVNGNKQTTTGNVLQINCENIGEYHVYCTIEEYGIRSNTIVIPSTAKTVESARFNYLGDFNGRSVNTFITSQSDMDALLEYCVLKDETSPTVYIDTAMQDIWREIEINDGLANSIYNGERYWIATYDRGEYVYKYVDKNGNLSSSNVVGNTRNGSPIGMMTRAFYRISYTGEFDPNGSIIEKNDLNKNGVTLTFPELPQDKPNKTTGQHFINQQGVWNYTEKNTIRNFPIDEIKETIQVSTSSELFDAVENGYKPVCTADSHAERVYNKARKVLSTYVTDNMSDYEKVKFIHDWICYYVTYDYAALDLKGSQNQIASYTPFYLDGVFGLPQGIAVCDGKSKAFTLMCAIEGIRSIRVTGECFKNADLSDTPGGHAWNKVYIAVNGKAPAWYVVDTTWDDQAIENLKGEVVSEKTIYTYFLVTDNVHNNPLNGSGYYSIEDGRVVPYPPAVTEKTPSGKVA